MVETLENKFSIVAFLDILGYEELIKKSHGRESELFNDLVATIRVSKMLTFESSKGMFDHIDKDISNKLSIKQFSDNVYFSFDYDNQNDFKLGIFIISNISSIYQRLMLAKGYYIRGGIAHGLNMMNEDLIFSTALIKAVKTEKETVYPRIALDSELKEEFLLLKDEFISKLYIQDWAGNVFINPFNQISRTLELIEKLSPNDLEKVKEALSTQYAILNKLNDLPQFLFDDNLFKIFAYQQICNELVKYESENKKVYEKYLWLKNFLCWEDKKESDLTFKYIS